MSLLYDRVMANGCEPLRLDALVPANVLQEERADFDVHSVPRALEAYSASDLEGIPVIVLDEAAEYVARLTVDQDGGFLKRTNTDMLESFFGVIRPPFDRCFVEFPLRHWQRGPGIRGGWLIEVEEAGESPEDAGWLEEARWFLSMSLVTEAFRKGVVYGPCITHVMPLNGLGEPLRSEGKGAGVSERLPEMQPTLNVGEDLYLRGVGLYLGFPAAFGLSLMNCKNVDMRAVEPPAKLARKAKRKTGREPTTYYVLDISPMRKILDEEGNAQTLGLGHALHICRGHFKTFSPDAPLFGRHTGTYWWAPQARGKAKHGTVEKDYRIRLDQGLGREYVEADEHPEIQPTAPEHTGLDPDLGARGLRAHNRTQNLLAQAVRDAGHDPRRPKPDEPQFDLAWEDGGVTWVAEVKSITPRNEESQLRHALSQALRYAQLLELEQGRTVRAMIVTEAKPTDATWIDLCRQEGIALAWAPDNLAVE